MNNDHLCESARMAFMAVFDGESDARSAAHEQHLLDCSPCRRWLEDAQTMSDRLGDLPYPDRRADLWPAVHDRISQQQGSFPRLWPIGAAVLAWRAVQLFIELPAPLLHSLVLLLALFMTLWLIARDPLAIETSAPELQKRGI